MMKTVKEIYDFFQQGLDLASKDLSQLVSSDPDFLVKNESGKVVDANMTLAASYFKVCEKMVDDLLMVRIPNNKNLVYLQNVYVSANDADPEKVAALKKELEYGSYDYKYRGFVYTHDCFSNSVLPIDGIKYNGNSDIGTAFYIGNNRFVTAAHCALDFAKFNVLLPDGSPLELKEVWVAKNHNPEIYDLAVITVEGLLDIPAFKLSEPAILDDVLVMGYPPISGFNAIQTSETATIGAYQKSSAGQVVGVEKPYGVPLDFFLINARVKGGNSGGPVINNTGKVVGVVVRLPFDIQSDSMNPRYDLMGYGVCLPSKYIEALIGNPEVRSLVYEKGYFHF